MRHAQWHSGDSASCQAFLRDVYKRQALSRSKADWIVGINGTRLFTTLYHKKLVVGRAQTPTLAMPVSVSYTHLDVYKRQDED